MSESKMAAPGERKFLLRVIFSCIGILVGVSVFCVFGFEYKNWNVSLWGLLSALPASLTLYVHIGNKKGRWNSAPERLKGYMYSGCFVQLAGVCGFVTYLVLGIVLKQGLIVYGNGYYLTCVWCFMVWKWGFLLFYFSRQYMRHFDESKTFLPKAEEASQHSYS